MTGFHYPSLSNEEYHDNAAISRSGILMFSQSPYKFWAHYLNPLRPPKKSTPAMEFGTAFHTFILEPNEFDKRYILEPEYLKSPPRVLLKNVGRPGYEAYKAEKAKIDFINERTQENFLESSESKVVLTRNDYELLLAMQSSITTIEGVKQLIEGALYEHSFIWEDKESGLMLKARPDILHANMIVDLKTIANASTSYYRSVMTNEMYHIQGAIIQDGIREVQGRDIPNVINICCEKDYPYQIGVKIIGEKSLDIGRTQYKNILMEMKKCFDTDVWPSYEPETVELPNWLLS